ncbi:hypothetical protein [Bradyrhizobium elkanii]|uniref:hypothetical protein n=1 Tax=Bradyrhizobium elkanii TaxID=29448 RepID=UPI0012BC5FCC|nr:hypothetical protein [Bradyrhizobium elkanii]
MPTDWNLIREMMAAVIDSCEQIEATGYTERDRDVTVDISGRKVSVQEFMVSAWTLPENLRYWIIRDRHDKGVDLPYIPDVSRSRTVWVPMQFRLFSDAARTERYRRTLIPNARGGLSCHD